MQPIDWSQVEIGESRFAEGKSVSRCREYHRAWQHGYKTGKRFRGRQIGMGVIEIWRVPCKDDGKAHGFAGAWTRMEIGGDPIERPGRSVAECRDYQRAQMYGQRTGKRFSGKSLGNGWVRITRVDDTRKPSHYPWCTMKVGDSVDVPGRDARHPQVEKAQRYGRRNNKRFRARTLKTVKKVRITRVK